MKPSDLPAYVEHFRRRVFADALQEATATYWHRRAAALDAALPRPDDFIGQATPAEIEEQRYRVAAAVLACRARAEVMLGGPIHD